MKLGELKLLLNNTKGLFFVFIYRLCNLEHPILKFALFPLRIFYNFFVKWILCIDIPLSTKIGFGFRLYHGFGVVIHKDCVLGEYVTIRQNTTIGQAKPDTSAPRIGNNVNIGANVVIIGDIDIGDNVVIGAGAIVVNDVPSNSLVLGVKSKVIINE